MSSQAKAKVKIVGSFATEYSLAKVNRGLAFAMADNSESKREVCLYADASIADQLPGKKEYERYPRLRELFDPDVDRTRFAIFNDFPKTFPGPFGLDKVDAEIKIVYLAWEESVFPADWVTEFNQQLHGVMVTSKHVADVMRNSGIQLPIVNVGAGLSSALIETKPEKYPLASKKGFKFLHVSSGLPRKGIDVLLKAYFNTFSSSDDVVLIIKTYKHDENVVFSLVEELSDANSPEVEIIADLTLSEGEMAYLYEQANAYVAPSRAEGFGLPMAEAMLLKLPLITTAYSGHMDFCNNENCLLVDYRLTDSQPHLPIYGSKWAEPDPEDLAAKLRYVYERRDSTEIKTMVEQAHRDANRLNWRNVVPRVEKFLDYLEETVVLKQKKLAVFSTFNSKCGIAEYSRDLYLPITSAFKEMRIYANRDANDLVYKDEYYIRRNWEYYENDFATALKDLSDYKPDLVHVQYNPPFYGVKPLAALLDGAREQGAEVFLTIHAPQVDYLDFSVIAESLKLLKRVFVHSQENRDYLEKLGLTNVEVFTHGLPIAVRVDKARLRKKLGVKEKPIIASHGIVHDKKGLKELVGSLESLQRDFPDILLLMLNAVNNDNATSAAVSNDIDKLIKRLGLEKKVLRFNEFLSKEQIFTLLQLADVIVLPYPELAEGASGAVRTAMAVGRPVLITPSEIFSDVSDIGFIIEDNKPETIAFGIKRLLNDPKLMEEYTLKAQDYAKQFSWEKQSREYLLSLRRD